MDIQKEKHNYLAMLVAEDAITQEQCSNLSLYNGGNYFHSDFLASSKVDCINWGFSAWLKAKAQAVPEGFVLVPRELSADEASKHAEAMFNEVERMARNEQRDLSESEFELFKNRWIDARTLTIQFDWKAMIEAREQSHDS